MKSRRTISTMIAALVAFSALWVLQTGTAAADDPEYKWLCLPGRAGDPCVGEPGGLLTKEINAAGTSSNSTPTPLTRLQGKIDCFYVYPTVSGQEGPNADLTEDPEIAGIAQQQAARFAPGCKMYAPIYKQYTVSAILGSGITEAAAEVAYHSVKAAWDQYLGEYNQGRGIVLIGHSQGTGHLKRLISETFDVQPELRKRLVSAVLIGGNVIVAKDQLTGGNFENIPGCSKVNQLGCVIAYSGFLKDPPPNNALFGKIGGALSETGFSPETHEILCVNPAELDGSKGALKPLYFTEPFPGVYGPFLPDLTGVGTPWASFPGLYTGSCRKANGASWLEVKDISDSTDARPRIGEPLGRTWGTHLTEVNDAAGNLLSVVTTQEATYVEKLNQPRKRALRSQLNKSQKRLQKLRRQVTKLQRKVKKASGKKRRNLKRTVNQVRRKATKEQKRSKSLRRQIELLAPLASDQR